jgi:hypothetical protein
MLPEDPAARRALLLASIATALGVALPACGARNDGSAAGARSPASSSATAREIRVRETPARDAHCGRD